MNSSVLDPATVDTPSSPAYGTHREIQRSQIDSQQHDSYLLRHSQSLQQGLPQRPALQAKASENSVAVLFPRYETVSNIYHKANRSSGKPKIPQVKYLGIVGDSKLSFQPHITDVRNRATCVMSRLYPFICKWSKMSLRNKLAFPIMTYAWVVLAHTK